MTLEQQADRLVVRLEGRLAGPMVNEATRCWQHDVLPCQPAELIVDLREVGFIDAAGQALLARMHRSGARLEAAGLLTRAIVEQVTAAVLPAEARAERIGLFFQLSSEPAKNQLP